MEVHSNKSLNMQQAIETRINAALGRTLSYRCKDLGRILEEHPIKECHTIIPRLLENIFGFASSTDRVVCWNLSSISSQNVVDFEAARYFLSPEGPLLTTIYQLAMDPNFTYEFPVMCLPAGSQLALEDNAAGFLYARKLQFLSNGSLHQMLRLNAFEYYIFHFMFYLIRPGVNAKHSWVNPTDSLYPSLFDSYLTYFLPVDKLGPPPVPTCRALQTISGSPPSKKLSDTSLSLSQSLPLNSSSQSRLSLFKSQLQSPVTQSRSVTNQRTVLTDSHVHSQHHNRSFTFLQIVLDYLLNDKTDDTEKFSVSHLAQQDYCSRALPRRVLCFDQLIPSSEHVRIVRILVKHLHYFSYSAHALSNNTLYGSGHHVQQWHEFKRTVVAQHLQVALYQFLRRGFEKWPLDTSFRLLLETWLSFIQPWRYTDFTTASLTFKDQQEQRERNVDDSWCCVAACDVMNVLFRRLFIAENFLFYVALFHDFIRRASRLDMTTSKNAYMLFRVARVYSSPNLKEILDDIESQQLVTIVPRTPGASYLNASGKTTTGAQLTQHIHRLEKPNHASYTPLFSETTVAKIQALLTQLAEAQCVWNKRSGTTAVSNPDESGLFGWLSPSSGNNHGNGMMGDELSKNEGGGKTKLHLEQAALALAEFFELRYPSEIVKTVTFGSKHVSDSLPDHVISDEGQFTLTPLGRYQVMNGLKQVPVDYSGDPDLQLIRSYECAPLVRILHYVSSVINLKYGAAMERWSRLDGLSGRFARRLFCSNRAAKCPRSSPSNAARVPPRLSLRWIASYHCLVYCSVIYFAMYAWWGVTPIGFVLATTLLVLCLQFVMALLSSDDMETATQ